jgi:serine phosphatase RsbU (regulator of sigma subunit)
MQIVNRGHMPPLLVDNGGAAYLGEGGLLLGLPMHEPHIEKAFLREGGTMVLMTDDRGAAPPGSQVADSR